MRKIFKKIDVPVIYALSRNLDSSATLKIILFVLKMNLNYNMKKDNNSSCSSNSSSSQPTLSTNSDITAENINVGKRKKEDQSSYFNEKTGLSFLNKNVLSDTYHYLWLKDDFICHPSTNFQSEKDIKNEDNYENANENNYESSSDLVQYRFTNENLDASSTSYDIIRFNDQNFCTTNNNELIIKLPHDCVTTTSSGKTFQYSKRKLYLFMKPTKEIISVSYQMNFIPIIPINFIINYIKQDIIQLINCQLYTSSAEFISITRKYDRLEHVHTLTLKDFMFLPIMMFVFAIKLYYIDPSSKSFALLRLLLMIHIKKQSFLDLNKNNRGKLRNINILFNILFKFIY